MRQLIVITAVFFVANVILVILGMAFAAPVLFTIALCVTGPGFFITLGAVFGRFSRDYTIVQNPEAVSRPMHRQTPLG